MQRVVIIPARGGSVGIPRKNLQRLWGRPLVGLAVETCKAAAGVDRVIVSTDDEEIAQAALAHGAEVVRRPAELSGGTASSESALLHALSVLDPRPDLVAFVQCTAPFLVPQDVEQAFSLLDQGYDCAFAAAPVHPFLWTIPADGDAVGINHDRRTRPRRQDMAPQYQEAGSVYVFRAQGFLAHRHRFFGRVGIVPIPASRLLDIDTPEDLALARRHGRPWQPAMDLRAIAFDFDGVLTDDLVQVDEHGQESVRCSRADGMGIERLRRQGVPMVVLSREDNPVVTRRCQKLGLPVHQGLRDKTAALRDWVAGLGLDLSQVAYVGNDINDLPAMRLVGWPVAPADAHPRVLDLARVVLTRRGGRGAVRELAELILPPEALDA